MQTHSRSAGNNAGLIEQIAQRKTFPNGIADQPRVQAVADAHQRCFLRGWLKSYKVLEPPCRRVLHEPADFKMPQIRVDRRIDHVFGDAVEQVVRRNRLNHTAFVLRAIVAEGCGAIQFSRQRHSATSRCEANCAQHECTASYNWSEFVFVPRDILCR